MLVDCEEEFDEFITRMDLLDDKLGPLLLQFPYFNNYALSISPKAKEPSNPIGY